jgi:hypothetical protein
MLPLSRSDMLWLEFPPFMLDMLEVVDSQAKSLKYVRTQNEQKPKATAQNRANRMVQFGKLDYPVPSASAAVKGTVGSTEGILLLVKWRWTRKESKIHDNSRSCGSG